MSPDDITIVILTRDEQPNIERCLNALTWATRILVVDSGSTDNTIAICRQFPNVDVVAREFDCHTNQWNFGIAQSKTLWVICLDSDYICPQTLYSEIVSLTPEFSVYFSRFRYLINGHPLMSTLYPPRAILFRKDLFCYVADGHTQLLDVSGAKTGFLTSVIDHDDRKSLSCWLSSQTKYAVLEADKLLMARPSELGWKDQLRLKFVVAPVLTAIYCLFWRRLILNGRAGLFYTLQRTYAELLLSLELLDRTLRRNS